VLDNKGRLHIRESRHVRFVCAVHRFGHRNSCGHDRRIVRAAVLDAAGNIEFGAALHCPSDAGTVRLSGQSEYCSGLDAGLCRNQSSYRTALHGPGLERDHKRLVYGSGQRDVRNYRLVLAKNDRQWPAGGAIPGFIPGAMPFPASRMLNFIPLDMMVSPGR
jgi:hypothetical protein